MYNEVFDQIGNSQPKLKIWLIKEGEDLPLLDNPRLMRMGSLAKYLSERGHSVVWWASTFIHGAKKYYINRYSTHRLNANETLVLLHSDTYYKKNISLARIKYHRNLAGEFAKHSAEFETPDIIMCAWPTPQFAEAAVNYGEKHRIPVVLDIRDFWPDIYSRAFPKVLRPMGQLVLRLMKRSCSNTIKRATGIVGKEMAALEWGCRYAGRESGENDTAIFIGNERVSISDEELQNNLAWWKTKGVDEATWNMCFFSTLSLKSIDLETVIKAVLNLSRDYPDIRLIIGGKGDGEEHLRKVAGNSPNIVFGGWLNKDQMNSVMKISKCGLYCLKNTEDFKNTFTNKAIQYLPAGLPIINSLTGFAKQFLSENRIGITYSENDISDCGEKIKSLYANETIRNAMASNAETTFNNVFESSVVNQQFENYFDRVVCNFKG
jgi:glycosyltransferase-like protein